MISAYSSFQLEATFTYAIALNFKQDIENIFSTGTNIVYICMLIKSEFQLSNMFCLKQNTQYPNKQNDVAFSQIISFCIRHENSFIQFFGNSIKYEEQKHQSFYLVQGGSLKFSFKNSVRIQRLFIFVLHIFKQSFFFPLIRTS